MKESDQIAFQFVHVCLKSLLFFTDVRYKLLSHMVVPLHKSLCKLEMRVGSSEG